MAETKPKVSRVKVKVPGGFPEGKSFVLIEIELSEGSLKVNDKFVLYLRNPAENNKIVTYPQDPSQHQLITYENVNQKTGNTYNLQSTYPFPYPLDCTFQRLNFNSNPDDDSWDSLYLPAPSADFTLQQYVPV